MYVPNQLMAAASLYTEKNKHYGNSYHITGQILEILFPNGIKLDTAKDFNRFSVFTLILGKIARYSNHWETPDIEDTMTDLSVYAIMLKELDNE